MQVQNDSGEYFEEYSSGSKGEQFFLEFPCDILFEVFFFFFLRSLIGLRSGNISGYLNVVLVWLLIHSRYHVFDEEFNVIFGTLVVRFTIN